MHAEFLDQLHEEYGDRVDFLTVYVRRPLPPGGSAKPGPRWLGEVDLGRWPLLGRYIAEAHASDEWSLLDSTNGVHEGKFDVQAAQSMEQRLATAREWVEWLNPKQEYAVDLIDDNTRLAYAAWPERLAVLEGDEEDTRVAYFGKQGPWGYNPSEVHRWLMERFDEAPPSPKLGEAAPHAD